MKSIQHRSLAVTLSVLALILTACGPSAVGPSLDPDGVELKSVDPGHALLTTQSGAVVGSHLAIMIGEESDLDWSLATLEPIEPNGVTRIVLDLTPGLPITVWATSGESSGSAVSAPAVFVTDPSDLPTVAGGGTEPSAPGLDPERITLEMLDDHHALIVGLPGAASGLKLQSLEVREGQDPDFELARDRPLGRDGDFQFVSDLYPGMRLHLRAVGPEGNHVEMTLERD